MDDLVVTSFETVEHDARADGTVFAHSTAEPDTDWGCPSAQCTLNLALYECRMQTAVYNCTATCGDHGSHP